MAYLAALRYERLAVEQVVGPDPNFHVFLAFGQSNMEGFPGLSRRTRSAWTRGSGCWLRWILPSLGRQTGEWYRCDSTALPQFDRPLPGRLFRTHDGGRECRSASAVGVINVAVAGCKIELFDKDTYQTYAATVAPWMTNIITQYGGVPISACSTWPKLAQLKGVIKGILLHQGESNTNDASWPNKVGRSTAISSVT